MEVGNHLPYPGNTSRHAANHVVLIPIVDSHVRVGWPDQDRINTAVALLKVVKVPVHGVLPRDGIIKVPILNHHLGLHETRLRPFQGGQIVPSTIVANTNTTFPFSSA
jgi:hypothetical protein